MAKFFTQETFLQRGFNAGNVLYPASRVLLRLRNFSHKP